MRLSSRVAFATLALLLLPSALLATNSPPPTPTPAPEATAVSTSISGAGAASKSASVSDADATSNSNSHADSASNSDASSSSDNTNENSNANANDSSASLTANYKSRLQAPSVSAPPVYASGTCASGWSAGVSVPGAGISGGKSRPDTNCDRRELVRVVTPLNPWLALKVACEDPIILEMRAANRVIDEDCVYVAPPSLTNTTTVKPSGGETNAPASPPVTKQEVAEMVDRAFKQSSQK